MTWSNFPVAGEALLNDLEDQTQQLYDALNERSEASGNSLLTDFSGDSLQKIPWRALHNKVRSIARDFLDTADYPNADMEGAGSPFNRAYGFSEASLYQEALGQEGFTKKRYYTTNPTHPSFPNNFDTPDGKYAINETGVVGTPIALRTAGTWMAAPDRGHADVEEILGIAEDGDIIGPWLWNELKLVIQALAYTYKNIELGSNGGLTWSSSTLEGSGSGADRESSISDALANAKISEFNSQEWITRANYSNGNGYTASFRMSELTGTQAIETDRIGCTVTTYNGVSLNIQSRDGERDEFEPELGGFPAAVQNTSSTFIYMTLFGSATTAGASSIDIGPAGVMAAPTASDFGASGPGFGSSTISTRRGCRRNAQASVSIFDWDFEYA